MTKFLFLSVLVAFIFFIRVICYLDARKINKFFETDSFSRLVQLPNVGQVRAVEKLARGVKE